MITWNSGLVTREYSTDPESSQIVQTWVPDAFKSPGRSASRTVADRRLRANCQLIVKAVPRLMSTYTLSEVTVSEA